MTTTTDLSARGLCSGVSALDPGLGLHATVLATVPLGFAVLVSQRTRLRRREEVIAEGQGTSRLSVAIDGFVTVRASGTAPVLTSRWRTAYGRQLDAVTARLRAVGRTDAALMAARLSSPVLLLLVAAERAAGSPGRAIGIAVTAGVTLGPIGTLATALDPATERQVEANLRGLTMTRIVVSHRVSTVVDADHVVVLDAGRIVEHGPPGVLLTRDGPFRRIVGVDRSVHLANREDPAHHGVRDLPQQPAPIAWGRHVVSR